MTTDNKRVMATKTREELRMELYQAAKSGPIADVDPRGFREPFMLGKPLDYWIEVARWLQAEHPDLKQLFLDLGHERSARLAAERKLAYLKARVKAVAAEEL